MSLAKIVEVLDGSHNRAALAGASPAQERKEQDANGQADAGARDFNASWLDPTAQGQDKIFAPDLRGNILGQEASEAPQRKQETFNKAVPSVTTRQRHGRTAMCPCAPTADAPPHPVPESHASCKYMEVC